MDQLKTIKTLVIAILCTLTGCNLGAKNYYLSAHASRADDLEALIDTWAICSSCLEHNICINSDIRNICTTDTLPDLPHALNMAASRANILAIRYLIELVGVDLNKPVHSSGETPLHISAYYSAAAPKYYSAMKYLLDNGADVNALMPNSTHPSPLERAVWKNNHVGIQLLGEYGAFKNQSNLMRACRTAIARKKFNIVPLLPGCCEIALGKELPEEYQDAGIELACKNH